jgi:EXLDI family protein
MLGRNKVMIIPNKTIYIADADLPLFEKAQQLAGDNLSATIVQALKKFVQSQEASAKGFEEITVKVGKHRPYRTKQFRGRLLAKRQIPTQNGMRWLVMTVYQTMRGRFAMRTKNTPNWSAWSGRTDEEWENWDWSSYSEDNELSLDVYDTLDELKEHIPEDFYESVVEALNGAEIEILDI